MRARAGECLEILHEDPPVTVHGPGGHGSIGATGYTGAVKLESLIEHLANVLDRHGPSIVAAYLFGSVADGRAGPESDVDIAILFAEAPASRLDAPPLAIEGALERVLRQPVQVVNLNSAPVDLAIRVLRQGRLIHETDRGGRIRFEVRVRNAFFDLEPVLRRYRRTERAHP